MTPVIIEWVPWYSPFLAIALAYLLPKAGRFLLGLLRALEEA